MSYKKEEADKAQRLLKALEAAGYSVVYDATGLNLNDNFADKLETLIRRARRVVVLWTEMSSASDWVRDEARLARDLEKYLGVVVEPKTDIALDLRNLHKIDITRMTFDAGADVIVKEIADQLGPGSLTPEVLAEASFYRAVEAGGSRGGYEAFLSAHPTGRYAELARGNLSALPRRRTASLLAAISVAVLMGAGGYFAAGLFGPKTIDPAQIASLTDDRKAAISARDAAIAAKEEAQTEVRRLTKVVASLTPRAAAPELGDTEGGSKAAISAHSAAIASVVEAQTEVKRLQKELRDLTRQVAAAAELRDSEGGSKADVERLMRERDSAKVAASVAEAALNKMLARFAKLEAEPVRRLPPLTAEPAKPDCRISGESGIEILGECRPLSTTILFLRDNQMTDATPVSGLTSLRRLFLAGTQIADASPLSGLTSLQRLDLTGTQIVDLAPLRNLTNLHYLRTPDAKIIGSPSDTSENRKAVADYIAAHSK